uniref:Cingulin like 1 n=1 Tax=Myotis myotis TaxID=51298 RepID=A0A7J8AJ11_MYOMY|nr:cingulin like 1 [Myotis myotis]
MWRSWPVGAPHSRPRGMLSCACRPWRRRTSGCGAAWASWSRAWRGCRGRLLTFKATRPKPRTRSGSTRGKSDS